MKHRILIVHEHFDVGTTIAVHAFRTRIVLACLAFVTLASPGTNGPPVPHHLVKAACAATIH